MGPASAVLAAFVGLNVGCGGKTGWSEAGRHAGGSGGTQASEGGNKGRAQSSGGAWPGDRKCHAVETYHYPEEACDTSAFSCGLGEAVFVDECGCGCVVPSYYESGPAWVEVEPGPKVDLATECNGASGLMALFEAPITHLMVLETEVRVWVGTSAEGRAWRVDKRTGLAALMLDVGESVFVEAEAGGFASRVGVTSTSGGYIDDLEATASVAVDSEHYITGDDGALWFVGPTLSRGDPLIVEQRGAYDDDDFPSLIAADDDAIYWLAGADAALRVADGDPLALYRTCRLEP